MRSRVADGPPGRCSGGMVSTVLRCDHAERRRFSTGSACLRLGAKACHPYPIQPTGLTFAGGEVDYRIWLRRAEIAGGGRDSKGSWRNWQTRKVEGLVPARACWFDSSRAHLAEGRGANAFRRELAAALKPFGVGRRLIEIEARCQQTAGLFFCAHAARASGFALMRQSSNVRQRLTIPSAVPRFHANRGDPSHA